MAKGEEMANMLGGGTFQVGSWQPTPCIKVEFEKISLTLNVHVRHRDQVYNFWFERGILSVANLQILEITCHHANW